MESTVSRPKPGDAEDLLGHDRARDQRSELKAEHRRHRDQAVPERVLADDRPLAQALGAGGAHVVGTERVEHRRAHLPHQHGARPVPSTIAGISMCLRFSTGSSRKGTYPPAGQPVQVDREDDDHQQAEPEVRDRKAEQGRRRRRVVRGLPAPDGGDHARRDPDHGRRSASRGTASSSVSGSRRDDRLCDRAARASRCRGRPGARGRPSARTGRAAGRRARTSPGSSARTAGSRSSAA